MYSWVILVSTIKLINTFVVNNSKPEAISSEEISQQLSNDLFIMSSHKNFVFVFINVTSVESVCGLTKLKPLCSLRY